MAIATGSIMRTTTPAGDPAWLATGYDAVRTLLGDPRLTRSHPSPERAARFSSSVMFREPARDPASERAMHQQMRRLLTPAFSARRMSLLRPRVRELAEGLLDELAELGPPADLHEALTFPLPALVICELLGVPYDDRADFRHWCDESARMDDAKRSEAGMYALLGYVDRLIERKRREPGVDVVSDLIAASDEDPEGLPPERVRVLSVMLLFAGNGPTLAAIDKGLLLLLTDPSMRAAVLTDPQAAARAVEEILRVPHPLRDQPPPFGLPRFASEDVEIDGVTIARGEMVMLSLEWANLDERAFPLPEAFDVARAANLHLAFGFGPHFCLGAPLARIELQTVFGTLFQRFPTLRLAVPVEELEELRPGTGLLTGGLRELPVTW